MTILPCLAPLTLVTARVSRPAVTLLAIALLGGCSDSPSDPEPQPPRHVSFVGGPREIDVGGQMTLQVRVTGAGDSAVIGEPVSWSSSAPAVATVVDGVVSGLTRGEAVIRARHASGAADSVVIGVVARVASATISGTDWVFPLGELRQLRATARDSAGADFQSPRIRWESSDTTIVKVSRDGSARAVGRGDAFIRAMVENRFVEEFVRVIPGYDLVVLGTLGGAGSRGLALNERGDVAGEAQTATGVWRAFLWRDGSMMQVASPRGRNRALALSESGAVAGITFPGEDTTGAIRPFLWKSGTLIPLAVEGDPEHVYAHDVNERDEVVGYTTTRCPNCTWGRAGEIVVWKGGVAQEIGRLGEQQAYGYGIDDGGRIAGRLEPSGQAIVYDAGSVVRLYGGWAYGFAAGKVFGSTGPAGRTGSHTAVTEDGKTKLYHVGHATGNRAHGVSREGWTAATLARSALESPPPSVIVVTLPGDGRTFNPNQAVVGDPGVRIEGIGAMNARGDIAGWGRDATGAVRAMLLRYRG